MRMTMLVLFSLVLLSGASQEAVTPVQKVIELLDDMVEKGNQEKQDEQVQFAKFKTFCDGTVASKQRAIEESNERMETLSADIEKFGSMLSASKRLLSMTRTSQPGKVILLLLQRYEKSRIQITSRHRKITMAPSTQSTKALPSSQRSRRM